MRTKLTTIELTDLLRLDLYSKHETTSCSVAHNVVRFAFVGVNESYYRTITYLHDFLETRSSSRDSIHPLLI